MKSAVDTARRLLVSLENFVEQECILLRSGHYTQMALVQRRAAPVIARLSQLGREPGVAILTARVSALLARRRENLSGLMARRSFLVLARERVAARRQRLQVLAPYRSAEASGRTKRLNAAV
jgi:flagellar biosynthesis/type III secretory pathway chaperone